jgi:O-succinylhomoserine sulfhydrylase
VYSRFTNPTVDMFAARLAALEAGECAVATSTGMSAMLALAMALTKAGDHIVASQHVFGSVITLLDQIMGRYGVTTTWVRDTSPDAFAKAMTANTKLVFIETPSNPLMKVYDIAAIADVAHKAGALFAVDNCFCSPALQQPLKFGADIVMHSATKYLDGQGRVLGGALVGSREVIHGRGIYNFLRTAGPSLSPFNAWVLLKGMETLQLRMNAQSASAMQLAQYLSEHPAVENVNYPWLGGGANEALARQQQSAGGAVITFNVKGGREAAWRLIDNTRLMSITGNLGDTRTTIIHPATTTHARLSQAQRDELGIGEGLVRIAVGLEAIEDLKRDLGGLR